jgi:hypothetical protein
MRTERRLLLVMRDRQLLSAAARAFVELVERRRAQAPKVTASGR